MSEADQNEEVAALYSDFDLPYGDVRGLACLLLECQADWWLSYYAQGSRPPPPLETTFLGRPSELGSAAYNVLCEVTSLIAQAREHVFATIIDRSARVYGDAAQLGEAIGFRRLAAAALLRDGWTPEVVDDE